MERNLKRTRSSNYSNEEKLLLLTIIEDHKTIIESKKTDQSNLKTKAEAWQKIANTFNANCPGSALRSSESLRKFYLNTKKNARKEAANSRMQRFATGGGISNEPAVADPAFDLISAMTNKKTMIGLENTFDSDAIPDQIEGDEIVAVAAELSSNHRPTNNTSIDPPRMRKPPESTLQNIEHQSTTTTSSNSRSNPEHRSEPRYSFKIGIYGWRKRCLYFLVLGLLVMVIVNLALTLWVLKVMEFSSEGMGQLRIVSGGLQLNGRAMVLDALIASSIRSRAGQPIVIESSRNLTLSTRNDRGTLDNRIFLGHDRFECLANNFMVTDDRGRVLFSANRREVVVGADELRVSGEGGVVFDGSVQTPLVRAEPGHDLKLESPTRSLDLRAPVSINIESRAGEIKATSLKDIKLQSVAGEIHLESASVMMPSIPTALPTSRSTSTLSGSARTHDVYQLCICANGKLFLAPSHGVCAVDEDSRVCR